MNRTHGIRDSSYYGGALVLIMSVGWLLPNHYPPWNTFHSNAWIAGALVTLALWHLKNELAAIRVSGATAFLFGCAAIPWIQHAAGLIALPSAALLDSLYLIGLAAAFALGENARRGNAGDVGGMVLAAACVASVVSVCIQIFQWLGYAENMDLLDIWIFPTGRSRPVANLGQPNQLGSLLLWGVLGAGWACHKGWIGRVTAAVAAGFILLGVAMTESRTALLTLTLAVAGLSVWRPQFLDRKVMRGAQLLYACYLTFLFGMAPLGRLLGFDVPLTVFGRSAGELRGVLWRMALDAASERPWQGFGWDEFNEGFLLVFPQHPALANLYAERSHNLALDLIIWVGWPLAVIMMLCTAWWLLKVVRSIADTSQLLLVAALGVMLVHAMLEMPLHYGYFLWPFGVVAGSATAALGWPALGALPRKAALAVVMALFASIATIVHDYLNIEAAFSELRFQLQHIGRNHDERPPRTYLLTDWAAFMSMSRTEPKAGMPESEIRNWEHLLLYNTSPLAFRKVVGALALNGHKEEARYWAERHCAVLPGSLCKNILTEWSLSPKPAAP